MSVIMHADTPGAVARRAADIAADICREFELELEARTGSSAQPDPVLSSLFHAFAVPLERLYEEAEQVFPEAVLDDLLAGMGLPPRVAVPAQTVVAFDRVSHRERIGPETQLGGYLPTGDRVTFTPDVSVELSSTDLVFAAVYEGGRLHAIPGAQLRGGPKIARGSVPLALDTAPAIFLAFDTDAAHLGSLGVYIETAAAHAAAAAIGRSPWQVLNEHSCVHDRGVLRATRGRGGVQMLAFTGAIAEPAIDEDIPRVLPIHWGPYGGQVWVFPDVPAERRHWCLPPAAIGDALRRLLPPEHAGALERPAVWVQIPLPAGITGVASAIERVVPNCITASNAEVWSERIRFDRVGTTVTLQPEGDGGRHVMGVLSVVGDTGERYVEISDPQPLDMSGRYRARGGLLEVIPGRHRTGRYDAYAVARLLLCDGDRANGVRAGDVCRVHSPLSNATVSVRSLTASSGGSAPSPYAPARVRFAELLRTRERVVTPADFDIACRAFDPRVLTTDVALDCERTATGLRAVTLVTARIRREGYANAADDLGRLRERLETELTSRSFIGQEIRVRIVEGD